MDDPWTGVLTSTWADVKTSLVVCLAEFKQKIIVFKWSIFMVDNKKLCGLLIELSMVWAASLNNI